MDNVFVSDLKFNEKEDNSIDNNDNDDTGGDIEDIGSYKTKSSSKLNKKLLGKKAKSRKFKGIEYEDEIEKEELSNYNNIN